MPTRSQMDSLYAASVSWLQDQTSEKLKSVLSLLTMEPTIAAHETLRHRIAAKWNERCFKAFSSTVVAAISSGGEEFGPLDPADSENRTKWADFFRAPDGSPPEHPGKRTAPSLAKFTVVLPEFNGAKGGHLSWWRKCRQALNSVHPDTKLPDRARWVPLVIQAFPRENLKEIFRKQVAKATVAGEVNFDLAMKRFIEVFDQHSVDGLWKRFSLLSQASREDIIDFQITFEGLVDDLGAQGVVLSPQLQWIAFRNKISAEKEIRKRAEIKTIQDAVDHVKRTSDANVKFVSDPD